MNIQSVNPSFQGKRECVDTFINYDDNKLRQLAYLKTAQNVDKKKNRRITNTLFYSAPLAAGLGKALLSEKSNTKIFSQQLKGTAGRMAKGLKAAALWTAMLGAVDLLGAAGNKLVKKSPEINKFEREHPLLSIGATLAAGFGVVGLVLKGASKLGAKTAPKFMQRGAQKVGKFLNKSKVMVGAKNSYQKLLSKTPEALKQIGASALHWAPAAMLFGGLFHSISSAGTENKEFVKNYSQLREKQARLTRTRLRELSMENDFFKQDAKNREDLALAKNPLKDLPPEVREKVKALRAAKEIAVNNFEV